MVDNKNDSNVTFSYTHFVLGFILLFSLGCSELRLSVVNEASGSMEVTKASSYRDDLYHYHLTDGKSTREREDHGYGFSLITDKKLSLGDQVEFRIVRPEAEHKDE